MIKHFSYTNARRSSRWRGLFNAPNVGFHFENSDSLWHQAVYLERPWHQASTGRTYWAERNATGEDTFGYFVFVHSTEDGVERLTDWDAPHTSAEQAVGSAMFLAAV